MLPTELSYNCSMSILDLNERDRLVLLKRRLNLTAGIPDREPAHGLLGATIGGITDNLGSREARIRFYQWAFDPFATSTNGLDAWQKRALVEWAQPAKLSDEGPWTFSSEFYIDLRVWRQTYERAT